MKQKLIHGNIRELAQKYGDWFLGNFVEENFAKTNDFEIKWVKREKGYKRPSKSDTVANQKTLTLLIKGKLKITLTESNEHRVLENEGDYLFYSPTIPHTAEYLEDSLAINNPVALQN